VDVLAELVDLARRLGEPSGAMAILAEGNVSARRDDRSFWVKGSGKVMERASAEDFSLVAYGPILSLVENREHRPKDTAIREALNGARVAPGPSPSTETLMHAWLLGLEGVRFVAHTHPVSLLALLSTEGSESLAKQRLFPDEIVLCGPESCWVPYRKPGLELAWAIADAVTNYHERWRERPKTLWLQNHGLITMGETAAEAEAATRMAEKAATVWCRALATGRPLRLLTEDDVRHIHAWPDEHARSAMLRRSQG